MYQLKKQWHKILSLIVVATIILAGVPISAAADENPPADNPTATSGVTRDSDAPVATSGNTDSGLLLDGGGDESCTCTAFQSNPDCAVCKDDETQCAFYYCVCEAVCDEDDINGDCPICRDDYTKCVQAVTQPELQPLTEITWNDGSEQGGGWWSPISGPATITVTGEVTVTGAIVINGEVTIKGGGTLKRGATFNDALITSYDDNGDITLDGVTLDGNSDVDSTAPLVDITSGGTSLTIKNSTLKNNIGGGVKFNSTGSLKISGSTIENNTGTHFGGVSVSSPTASHTVLIENSTIKNNTAPVGGGLLFQMSTATIKNCTIMGNKATGDGGGGVFAESYNILTIEDSSISNNEAVGSDGDGGGISFGGDTVYYLTMNRVKINGNKSARYGGGVYSNGSTLEINGGEIKDNEAKNGGGVYAGSVSGVNLAMKDTEISGNKATGVEPIDGGGMYCYFGSFKMRNVKIMNNEAVSGGGIYNYNNTAELIGGEITGNKLTSTDPVNGGGVYGVIRVGGTLKITDNKTSDDKLSNYPVSWLFLVQLFDGTDKPADGMKIYLTGNENQDGVVDAVPDYAQYFEADDPTLVVAFFDPNFLRLVKPTEITSVAVNVTAPVTIAKPATTVTTSNTEYTGTVAWSPTPINDKFQGGKVYTATITLKPKSGYIFPSTPFPTTVNGQAPTTSTRVSGSELKLTYTFPETAPATVESISVKTQPTKLDYAHGEALDLTGLVVTLSYNDDTTEDKSLSEFTALSGASISPTNGSTLSETHDGKPVTVTLNGKSATTANLTVKPDYTGIKTASATVPAGKATANATLTLPPLPAGANYPSSGTVSGALISSHSISLSALTYSTTSQSAGTSATITIPVTNATNYNRAED